MSKGDDNHSNKFLNFICPLTLNETDLPFLFVHFFLQVVNFIRCSGSCLYRTGFERTVFIFIQRKGKFSFI